MVMVRVKVMVMVMVMVMMLVPVRAGHRIPYNGVIRARNTVTVTVPSRP
jgi:hypothetical protein